MKNFRKIIMVAFLILGATFNAQAQSAQVMQLQETSERLYGEFRELAANKNYAEAIVPIKELINYLDTTTVYNDKSINIPKQALDAQKAMYQYDLACCYAIMGKKKMAMETLTASVGNGYDNYGNMCWDNDLASLKKDKKFQALLG